MAGWLVVGLGNPGPTYARNRHNIGAMVVDELARRGRVAVSARKLLKANTADIQISPGGIGVPSPQIQRVVLATTRTYMNESGVPVRNLLGNLKTRLDHLIVIHDELDLDVGRMRVKFGGGDNGHNGLKSIRAMNGGGDYFRVRLGIGRPPGRQEVTDWVLTNFSASEKDTVAQMVIRGADAVEHLILQGLDATQSHFNN